VQKLYNAPPKSEDYPLFRKYLDGEIAALDRLVERAMKKKPKSVKGEEEKPVPVMA
jgi:hypothetical protein